MEPSGDWFSIPAQLKRACSSKNIRISIFSYSFSYSLHRTLFFCVRLQRAANGRQVDRHTRHKCFLIQVDRLSHLKPFPCRSAATFLIPQERDHLVMSESPMFKLFNAVKTSKLLKPQFCAVHVAQATRSSSALLAPLTARPPFPLLRRPPHQKNRSRSICLTSGSGRPTPFCLSTGNSSLTSDIDT